MSRPAPRRLPVPPGSAGVDAVAGALSRIIAGDDGAYAIAPELPGSQVAAAALAALRPDAPLDFDDASLLIATSGSSGEPRGVALSRGALLAAAEAGAAALGAPGLWLTAVPVTGIGGILTVARSLLAGTPPTALPGVGGARRFDTASFAEAAARALDRAGALGLPCYVSLVPTQLRRLLDPEALDVLAAFDAVLVGGAPLPEGDRVTARAAGVRVVCTYGATETCGGVVYDGSPIAGVGLAYVEPDSGEPVPGGPGQVVISGPTLALGYRLRPDLTEAAFRADGFHSADYAQPVPGGLQVLHRLDLVVKVGGQKVSLAALANALRDHPSVVDAVVVAESDPEWGMVPVAYVVAESPGAESPALAAELAGAAAVRLGRASTPRRVEFVAELPRTHTGKSTAPGTR